MPDEPEPTRLEQQLRDLTAAIRSLATASDHEGLPRYRSPHDRTGDYDRLDRREGHWMELPHYLLYVDLLKRRARNVPDRAVAEYGDDEDGQFTLIECPCGAKPIARTVIEKCPGCERYYLLQRKGPLVVYGDMEIPTRKASE